AEAGTAIDIFDRPSHPYTQGLLASIPRLDTPPKSRLAIIPGMVPGLLDLPKGCRFENRCPHRREGCLEAPPPMEQITDSHRLACYRWREIGTENVAGGTVA
ncbi:MAG TPA: oligopeptide/dipeptide ABC transporter ATP-binding protein, partial [Pseudohongiella sp.]|nr:oligopeptide/dipeptide ABC transporter ATP-binding protein [Pseudohongiella sp.]